MTDKRLSVRELRSNDIKFLAKYWTESDPYHLQAMGVDLTKLPSSEGFTEMLQTQLSTPIEERRSYCIIWELEGEPIGHCNTNPTTYGEEAAMHLHIWDAHNRNCGLGRELLKMTLPYFFNNLKLKRLYSKSYAQNEAPSKTLVRLGFELIKEYITIPGPINFEQPVKRWELTAEKYAEVTGA